VNLSLKFRCQAAGMGPGAFCGTIPIGNFARQPLLLLVVSAFFPSLSGRSNLKTLLRWTIGGCLAIFILLELWRPCYFLTDDNLDASFPVFTEMGRNMKAGHTPFVSEFLFGGGYNYLRDFSATQWHPFFLVSTLLADTPARFWMIDVMALLFLLVAAAGIAVLAHSLREELSLKIPDGYLVFYCLSYVFSAYVLTVGPSWVNFLANLGALPWLTLGILDRKTLRGTLLVLLFTVHEILAGYAPLTLSGGLCLTLFALGVARWRRSIQPLFCWGAGNLIALLLLSPLLLSILDGFAHTVRMLGYSLADSTLYSIPAPTFFFSFFIGNWTEPVTIWQGDRALQTLEFPCLSSILACAAAWCLIPALFVPGRWRPLDKICAVLAGVLVVTIIRPEWLATAIYHLPFFRSMRWPFREGVIFLFFVHLFLILRFPERMPRWQPAITLFSLAIFLLPLPFIRVPTFNPLFLDRQLLFSGQAERFWAAVKPQLGATDDVATVIDWPYWQAHAKDIPYTLLDTANYPAFFQVRCISAYDPTAPTDQLPLKTSPGYWFGAFRPDQVNQILAERPDLRLLRIENVAPLKITMSTGAGPEIDLTPYLQAAQVKAPDSDPVPPSGH